MKFTQKQIFISGRANRDIPISGFYDPRNIPANEKNASDMVIHTGVYSNPDYTSYKISAKLQDKPVTDAVLKPSPQSVWDTSDIWDTSKIYGDIGKKNN